MEIVGASASAADMSCGSTDLDVGSSCYASINDRHGNSKGVKDGKVGGGVSHGNSCGSPGAARVSNFNRAILAFPCPC